MANRARHVADIYDSLAELMKTRSTAEWIALLEKADIPVAPMNSVADVLSDPHLAASGFFYQEDHPSEGKLRATRTPTDWSESQPGRLQHLLRRSTGVSLTPPTQSMLG